MFSSVFGVRYTEVFDFKDLRVSQKEENRIKRTNQGEIIEHRRIETESNKQKQPLIQFGSCFNKGTKQIKWVQKNKELCKGRVRKNLLEGWYLVWELKDNRKFYKLHKKNWTEGNSKQREYLEQENEA